MTRPYVPLWAARPSVRRYTHGIGKRENDVLRWLAHLGVFVLILAVMKFFFGWNISIIGSVVFTLIFGVIFALIDRR
jgi:hypothetical protein